MIAFDPSAGLDPSREYAIRGAAPVDKPRYGENYMLSAYDPKLDLGMWLHWGTCPDSFSLWEEMVMITLPGDNGLLWTRAYHKPRPEDRPNGPNLHYRVVEPFRQLQISFEGVAMRTPYQEMLTGRVRDTSQELLDLELDVRAAGPAWDNHLSAESGTGRGSMKEQTWASEHFQQPIRVRGTVRVDGRELAFDGSGTRDHSRGQRGHGEWSFGGHNLMVAPFDSGKSFGMQRMWTPKGKPTLEVAFVCIDGEMRHCDIVTRPAFLEAVRLSDDPIELVLRSSLGDHVIRGRTAKTIYSTVGRPWSFHLGADLSEPRGLFVPGFAVYEWDGETAAGLCERSGPVGVAFDLGRAWSVE